MDKKERPEESVELRLQWRRVQVAHTMSAIALFLSVLVIQIVAVSVVSLCVYMCKVEDNFFRENYVMLASALSGIVSFAWCGWWYKKSSWRLPNFSYKNAYAGKTIPVILGIAIGGNVSLSLLLSLLQMLVPAWFVRYQGLMNSFSAGAVWLVYLYVWLLGPVAEEMLFRGVVMDRFLIAFPFWTANILQAALFGLFHGNVVQGLYAFALGLVLGLIRQMTGTITASMMTHILFNGTSYFLQWAFPSGKNYSIWIFIVLLGISFLCFMLSLWYTLRKVKMQTKEPLIREHIGKRG